MTPGGLIDNATMGWNGSNRGDARRFESWGFCMAETRIELERQGREGEMTAKEHENHTSGRHMHTRAWIPVGVRGEGCKLIRKVG